MLAFDAKRSFKNRILRLGTKTSLQRFYTTRSQQIYEHYLHVHATRALVRRVEHSDATRVKEHQALDEKVRLATSLLSVYRQATTEQRPPNPTPPHLDTEDEAGEDEKFCDVADILSRHHPYTP